MTDADWSLRRIHDLEVLLQEAIAAPLEPDTLEADLQTLHDLIALIRLKVAS